MAIVQGVLLYGAYWLSNGGLIAGVPRVEFESISETVYQGKFVYIETALQRLARSYITSSPSFPNAVFMIRDGPSWILVDTGMDHGGLKNFPQGLLWSVGNLTEREGGDLRLVFLTHGHTEHSGALWDIIKAYPLASVGFHVNEKFYIVDKQSYKDVESDNAAYRLWANWEKPYGRTLPPKRIFFLQESEGDLADLAWMNGMRPGWLPTPGLVKYYLTPGHSPGHTVLLLPKLKLLLAGDLFNYVRPSNILWPWPKPPAISTIMDVPMHLYNADQAQQAIDNVLSLDWEIAYPSHSWEGVGLSKHDVAAYNQLPKGPKLVETIQQTYPARLLSWFLAGRVWKLMKYLFRPIGFLIRKFSSALYFFG